MRLSNNKNKGQWKGQNKTSCADHFLLADDAAGPHVVDQLAPKEQEDDPVGDAHQRQHDGRADAVKGGPRSPNVVHQHNPHAAQSVPPEGAAPKPQAARAPSFPLVSQEIVRLHPARRG